jgi:cellulose synthase/poly-beta-1,6-N-acetylglucosamine synthase-like glycosyltransferase
MRDFELLLIVNGQESAQIAGQLMNTLAKDDRVRIVNTSVHLLNFSLTLGLHLSGAPFIARMDADDVAHPERLASQLAFMERYPDVAVLGSSYQLIDENGKIKGQVKTPQTDYEIRKALRFRNPICHPSVMMRRDPILQLGGYLGGKNAEDYDLWLRLARDQRWKFANLPESLLSYNVAPDGTARRSREAYANVAGAQFRQFLIQRDLRWLMGALASSLKSFLFAKRL